jgi:hypothetical protein
MSKSEQLCHSTFISYLHLFFLNQPVVVFVIGKARAIFLRRKTIGESKHTRLPQRRHTPRTIEFLKKNKEKKDSTCRNLIRAHRCLIKRVALCQTAKTIGRFLHPHFFMRKNAKLISADVHRKGLMDFFYYLKKSLRICKQWRGPL